MKLSEKDRNAAFAFLVVLALGAAAYVFFVSEPADLPSDGKDFYYMLKDSEKAGILYDVRGAEEAQVSSAYQCGVDMISKGRFVGKTLENIACDDSGCLSVSTGSNGSSSMTFEQAKKKFASLPYVLIKTGEKSSYRFFQRHMEIVIGIDLGNSTSCDIAAKES